jgi:hypothetical protein
MKRGGHAAKKARLDLDAEEEQLDPIAAAIEAKRKRAARPLDFSMFSNFLGA